MINNVLVGRKRLFITGMMLMLLLSTGLWQPQAPTAFAQSSLAGVLVGVVPDTHLNIATEGTGPFYVEAQVFSNPKRATGDCTILQGASLKVGTLRIWGFRTGVKTDTQQPTNLSAGSLAVVNMSLDLPDAGGSIEMQGTLGRVRQNVFDVSGTQDLDSVTFDVVTVTGGTGRFRGANGEAVLTPLVASSGNNCQSSEFRLSFQQHRNR